MKLHERPWLPEVLGWIPIALTLGILFLVLYRITFAGNVRPQHVAAAATTPSSLATSSSETSATRALATASVPPPATAQPVSSAPTSTSGPTASTREAVRTATAVPSPDSNREAQAVPPSVSKVLTAEVRAASPTAASAPGGDWSGAYVVVRGDSLSIIAARYKVSVQDLQQKNHIEQANRIDVGQKLIVPAKP